MTLKFKQEKKINHQVKFLKLTEVAAINNTYDMTIMS